jgi:large subunit ribosomal protein L5
MASATADAPPARLKERYVDEIRPALIERFGYSSVMQAPRLEKITVNMGVGMAKQDSKVLKAATEQLATIAGQQPSVRRARKSIAAFKLREGMPVGVAVTLRGDRAYEFLDRLVSIAIPRIRDFRGLNARSFDHRGNYSMGVREQIIFPEIDYDAIDQVRGMDITITTSAKSDVEAYALLAALGMPFSAQGRPKGYDPEADAAAEAEHQAAETQAAAAPHAPAAEVPAPDVAEQDATPADDEQASDSSASADVAQAGSEQADETAPAADGEQADREPTNAAPADAAPSDADQADADKADAEPAEEPQAADQPTADSEQAADSTDEAGDTAEKESSD